jgi:hypothetical protein
MSAIISGAEYATFINTFRCQASNQEEVVRINVDIIEQVASAFSGLHLGGRPPQHGRHARLQLPPMGIPPSTSPRCSAHPSSRRSAVASPA